MSVEWQISSVSNGNRSFRFALSADFSAVRSCFAGRDAEMAGGGESHEIVARLPEHPFERV